jgi:hypothetical protein
MFSLYLTDFVESSFAIIGGYSSEVVEQAKTSGLTNKQAQDAIFWLQSGSENRWQLKNKKSDFGGANLELSSEAVILDSASGFCSVPEAEFGQIRAKLLRNHNCTGGDAPSSQFVCACEGDEAGFPTLAMQLGDDSAAHWFFLTPRDYLERADGRCRLLITEMAEGRREWVLGTPFLRAYYSIYDLEQARIGLVGIAETARASPLTVGSSELLEEIELLINSNSSSYGVIMTMCIIFVAIFIVVCCWMSIRAHLIRRDEEQQNKEKENEER